MIILLETSLTMTILYRSPKRLPRWTSEHIQLRQPDSDFIRSTINTMQQTGRARNVIEVHHSGKHFLQFERRLQLTFKRIRNK